MSRFYIFFIFLISCYISIGCDDSSRYEPNPDEYGPLQVTLVNQSEFDIKRVYFHTEIDNYKDTPKNCDSIQSYETLILCLIENKIKYLSSYSIQLDGIDYLDKPYNKKTYCFNGYKLKYVTFIRQIATTVENEIAVTTEIPLDLIDGLVELNIFAEDFFYTRAINSSKICQDSD